MNDTPETDAKKWIEVGYNSYVVSAGIAQKLERERDNALAQIETISPKKNNPVAEFFSSSSTPETDAFAVKFKSVCGSKEWVPVDLSRRLERERDEARADLEVRRNLCDEARDLVYAWENRWKAEVEFAATVSLKCDELRDILRKLLEIIPEPECHDFGHTKEERHAFLEKCPVMARYDALIAQAREVVK